MKAIILAAGAGSRLERLFPGLPKCLIPVEGVTLLEHQVATLRSCGVDEIVVVTGFQRHRFTYDQVVYCPNDRWEKGGILASLDCAADALRDDVIVLYSDILFESDLIRRLLQAKGDINVGVMVDARSVYEQRDASALKDLELVCFDGSNQVEAIGKKEYDRHSNIGQFIGIAYLTAKGTAILGRHLALVRSERQYATASLCDLLDGMVQLGVPVTISLVEKGWLEINTEEDYERACRDTEFVRRISKVYTDWSRRAVRYNDLDWVNKDELLRTIVEVAGDVNGKRLLDVGTGTAKIIEAFSGRYPAGRYYGVDRSWDMLAKVKPGLPVRRIVADVEQLGCLPQDYFDVVTARMLFHHVGNLGRGAREVRNVLKPGGTFIVCEGNPPDLYSGKFYTEMFRLKEDRHTLFETDLINLFVRNGFEDVTTRTIVLRNMSLANWLSNSGLPQARIDQIRDMHVQCDERVKDAYNMRITGDDVFMDWKFSVVYGVKRDQ
jgi:choline kinase/ubiquinone/menaquinone biosynthesis C-methylase UbiE